MQRRRQSGLRWLLIRVIPQQHVVNRTCREAIGEVRQSIDTQMAIAECLGRDRRAGVRRRERGGSSRGAGAIPAKVGRPVHALGWRS